MPKYSYVITEGFTKSHVLMKDAIGNELNKVKQAIADDVRKAKEVETVDTLPTTGEEGKFYYNTTDKKYYTYDADNGFVPVGSGDFEVVRLNENHVDMQKNKLYISTHDGYQYLVPIDGTIPERVGDPSFIFTITDILATIADDVDGPYLARFTCQGANTSVTVRALGPVIPKQGQSYTVIPISDSAPDEFEVGHTYEINILGGLASIYDVTASE